MKQRVVDSVTVEESDLMKVDPGKWMKIESVNGHLQVATDKGLELEVDSSTLKILEKSAAVFQTCSECKKKIECFYRSMRQEIMEVAFVKCECGHYPVVLKRGVVVGRLNVQFDSTRAYDDNQDQAYNRSVWSTSTALLYCEKTSRLVVEYQWKDLEAGQFDKHSVKLSGIESTSKVADILVERDFITYLFQDGSLIMRGSKSWIRGTL